MIKSKPSLLKYLGLAAPLVIFIDLTLAILSQSIQSQMEHIINYPSGQMHMIWVWGSTNLVLYIVLNLLSFTVALFALTGFEFQKIGPFIGENFGSLAKEGLRSMGKVLLWSYLLIVPGIIRLLQLSMVPFVVAFDPKYHEGQVNALKASTSHVNKAFFRVAFVELIFYFGLTAAITAGFSRWTSFTHTPLAAIVLTAAQSFVFLLSVWLLYLLYKSSYQIEERQ